MVSADEDMPVRGSGTGRGKAEPGKKAENKKAEKRSRKPRQKAEAKADQLPETQALETQALETRELIQEPIQEPIQQPIDAPVASAESSPIETPVIETTAIDIEPAAPAQPAPAPVGYQAVTNAYGDFTRKSIEQTSSFFEQISGARSFNRAFQLQAEYAQRAYETFVVESRRIGDLHRELTLQRMKQLEGLVTGTKKATGSK